MLSGRNPDFSSYIAFATSLASGYNLYDGDALDQNSPSAADWEFDAASRGWSNNYDLLFDFGNATAVPDPLSPDPLSNDMLEPTVGNDALGSGLWRGPGGSARQSFIDGEIAGVLWFLGRLIYDTSAAEIYRILDSVFGGLPGGLTIVTGIDPTPEPKTMFLVGVALIALSLMRTRRRHP